MSSIKRLIVAVAMLSLAACGSNTPPPAEAAKAQAAAAQAANEAKAAKDVALYDQMRSSQSWDLATSLGDEIVRKYPGSTAATQVKQTLEDVRAKATAQRESRRLARLWAYAATPESGGTQYTAAVESKDPLKSAPSAKDAERIRLVLRQHPQWGQSVYLLLDNAKFDCSKGCATLPVRFDDAPAQRMKATIPPTGEPALFIDDDKGFIAKMQKAKTVAIDATIKGEGAKTFVFEIGGYDAAKLPGASRK
jgi:predicted small lipoprotein YifL